MSLVTKKIFLLLCIFVFSTFSYIVLAQNINQWDVTMRITWLGIRHGTPENFPIWVVSASPTDQEVSWQFIEPFWVEDIQGYITGHYTTIQCDGIYGPAMTKLTWIELKAGTMTPELLMGTTWPNVAINPALSIYQNITEPITYIYKDTDITNAGIVNKYGDKPWIKILIPTATPPGVYSGTIVFSFYME